MIRLSGNAKAGATNLALPLLILASFLLNGCGYKQNHVLFQSEKKLVKHGLQVVHLPADSDTIPGPIHYDHIIRVGDHLSVKFLNNYDITTGITMAGGSKEEVTFLVDGSGNVTLPMVGSVNLLGLNRYQAATRLEEVYSSTLREPRIEVQIVGMKVFVHGEVLVPGEYLINGEDVSLVEIISRAGGITSNGNSRTVRMIRANPLTDTTMVVIVDMTNVDVLHSKNLIVHDKDIIVVEPTNIRVVTLAVQPYYGLLTLVSTIATISVFFLQITRTP